MESTKAELLAKIELLEADLATYKSYMQIVRQKARSVPPVGDALFQLVRRYQKQLKLEANR